MITALYISQGLLTTSNIISSCAESVMRVSTGADRNRVVVAAEDEPTEGIFHAAKMEMCFQWRDGALWPICNACRMYVS